MMVDRVRFAGPRDTVVICDLVSLEAWRRELHRFVRSKRLPAVEFRLADLAHEQNRSFSLLAAGYRKACGCAIGGLFMTIAVIATIAYLVTHPPADGIERGHVVMLGVPAAAALVGKLLGLIWARGQLLVLARTVQRAIVRARQSCSSVPAGVGDSDCVAVGTASVVTRDPLGDSLRGVTAASR